MGKVHEYNQKKKKKKPESKDQHLGHFKILAYSLDKEDVVHIYDGILLMVHIYDGILLSHKKEWSNAIYSKMDRPRDDHIKWSQTEKDKCDMILLRFGI